MEKELEAIAKCCDMKVAEETLRILGLTEKMARTVFYEAIGVAVAGLVSAAYAGYELVSYFYN
jgi:hypothetical protein